MQMIHSYTYQLSQMTLIGSLTCNLLLLNKTEVIMLEPKHLRNTLSDNTATLASSTTVRNLGVILDLDLPFNSHIKQMARTPFFHLWNIVKIRNISPHLLLPQGWIIVIPFYQLHS